MKQNAWLRLVNDFNDNDHDSIINNFGDVESFFEILKKKDLLHLIDPETNGSEYWINTYLIHLYDSDYKEMFYDYVLSYLGYVERKGGKFYFYNTNREELAQVFCDNSRNTSSRDIAERILDTDADYYEPFNDTTNDVYRDVIGELNDKNLQKLGELIVFELKYEKIGTDTELLEDIAQEQNHPEFAIIDQKNVQNVIDDEETMNYLLINHLGDMKSNLYSAHHNSYNTAYNDDLFIEIWSELQTYFVGQGSFIQKSISNKFPEKTVEHFEIEIVNFESNILEYLKNNKNYGNTGTLNYQGSYINILKEDFDCLNLSFNDYPDYRKVDKYINEYFNDYL